MSKYAENVCFNNLQHVENRTSYMKDLWQGTARHGTAQLCTYGKCQRQQKERFKEKTQIDKRNSTFLLRSLTKRDPIGTEGTKLTV